ncbi:hypothetical protein F2Q68_00008496 [Brassica cretica]|uniref:Uncharacterized protein n=1 Tax=Brassica cretica TaxID=69181 RepID=A0A8S9L3S7_BRACR|nr:hypothetical protein F2Q68_00008496 [Brassica cretica]
MCSSSSRGSGTGAVITLRDQSSMSCPRSHCDPKPRTLLLRCVSTRRCSTHQSRPPQLSSKPRPHQNRGRVPISLRRGSSHFATNHHESFSTTTNSFFLARIRHGGSGIAVGSRRFSLLVTEEEARARMVDFGVFAHLALHLLDNYDVTLNY